MAELVPWVFCQLGAREHYVLPEGLHRRGLLRSLVTDRWVVPGSAFAAIPGNEGRRLAERYNPALADAPVLAFTASSLVRASVARLSGQRGGWADIMASNRWFGRRAARALERSGALTRGPRPVVFAYSYAALEILQAARAAGCVTVLGQIDPAIAEEERIARIVASIPAAKGTQMGSAPPHYWDLWQRECALADHIVVNSPWSRDGLAAAGIAADKLHVVPLALAAGPAPPPRSVPARFDAQRPLRVLFLGSLIARKGIVELLDAARLMAGQPVEFHLVGPAEAGLAALAQGIPGVTLHGPVPRHAASAQYAAADLFVLPTHSDGFGLTQLEAMAQGLPVIASRHCGAAVRHGHNGQLLDAISGSDIARAIGVYLTEPSLIVQHGQAAAAGLERFSPNAVVDRLAALAL